MKAQTWRRTALAAYILAGASLTVAGYTVATTEANANALYRFAEHDNDAYSARSRSIAEGITAAALSSGLARPRSINWVKGRVFRVGAVCGPTRSAGRAIPDRRRGGGNIRK
ncbi:MAG: hypothetical protein BWY57_01484 [Betaproteobacteria bacterium ADurb.Bin341]|nr:MAG: hypothetical protein BWY57_01484 [Betaproteobacteria bacterium ADurb.Bin341]